MVAVCDLGRAAERVRARPERRGVAAAEPARHGRRAAAGDRRRRGDRPASPSRRSAGRKCSCSPISPPAAWPEDGVKRDRRGAGRGAGRADLPVRRGRRGDEERVAGRARDRAAPCCGRASRCTSRRRWRATSGARRRWSSLCCRRGRRSSKSAASGSSSSTTTGKAASTFEVADLPLGTHQGSVQLVAADPLAVDNTRYFTVEVRPPARVLLLAERVGGCAVRAARRSSPSLGDAATRFECDVAHVRRRRRSDARRFSGGAAARPRAAARRPVDAAVASTPRAAAAWASSSGTTRSAKRRRSTARRRSGCCPASCKRISREETYLRPRRLDHPALAGLRDYDEEIPWQVCQVFRFWQFDELAGDAYVVATFANDEPAILERHRRPRARADRDDAVFRSARARGPRAVERARPTSRGRSSACAISWPATWRRTPRSGSTTSPAKRRGCGWRRGSRCRTTCCACPTARRAGRVAAGGDELAVGVTDELGNYRLTAGGASREARPRLQRQRAAGGQRAGARSTRRRSLAALPKDRVRLADDLGGSGSNTSTSAASGRELYPWAIALVALVWGAEHVLANRFYRARPRED